MNGWLGGCGEGVDWGFGRGASDDVGGSAQGSQWTTGGKWYGVEVGTRRSGQVRS